MPAPVKLVTYDDVERLAGRVNQQGDNLNQVVGQLTAEFRNSESYWKGGAATQFNQAFEAWNTSWGKMHHALVEMHQVMLTWLQQEREHDQV